MPDTNNKKPASLFTVHPVEALLYGASMILAGACFAAMGGLPLAAGLAVGALTAVATTTKLPQLLKQKLSRPDIKKMTAAAAPVATPTTSKTRWQQKLKNIFKRASAPQTSAAPETPKSAVAPAAEPAPAQTPAPAAAA